MTEAEKYLLTLKEKFVWTTFITSDVTHIVPRIVSLHHNTTAGFFIVSRKTQRKNKMARCNPAVTVSIFPGSGFVSAVASATARVSSSKDDVDKCWSDEFLKVNFKGKDDPDFEVIILTIHSVTLGTEVYKGVPIDYSKYDVIDKNTPLKPLPSPPYQTTEAITELKKVISKDGLGDPPFHLITFKGIYHNDRIMKTRYDEKYGVHQFTRTDQGANKLSELQTNANVALLCEIPSAGQYLVADCTARVCTCTAAKAALWTDDLKQHQLTGANDSKLALILFSVRSVAVFSAATHTTQTYVCEPSERDKGEQVAYRVAASRENVYLNTVDKKGVPHSRMMWFMHFHPTIGFLCTTREDNKTVQIRGNPHVTVTCFDAKTTDEYVVDALGTVVSDPGRRHLHWTDKMKSAGYTGAEDESQVHIALNITGAKVRNLKAFWASVGRPEDGGKWQ